MARISEQIIEQIRSTADIYEIVSEYVQLKKRGRNFFGLCPFHDEKTPSFSINQQRQIYKCFGCDAGGGTINFIMEIERLEFIDAIQHLADRYKIELNIENMGGQSRDVRTQLIDLHEKTSQIYQKNLTTNEGNKIQAHLEKRGITSKTIEKFRLGYSLKQSNSLLKQIRAMGEKAEAMRQSGLFIDTKQGYIDRFRGRIMFSIADASGKIIAFAGRVFESDDPAKYINSPKTPIYNKSRILYGLHESKQAIREKKSVIVAGRLKRHRSVTNKFCYFLYWLTARALTGHSICFGNFSALSPSAVAKIGKLETTPVHFAATIIASSLSYSIFRIERNKRYCSQSKMTFVGLIKLAFRSISLFRRRVFVRLTALSVPGLILWADLLYFQFFLDTLLPIANQKILLVFLSLLLFISILGFIFLGFFISTIKSNKRIVENTKNVNILTSDPVTTT